MPFPLIPVIAAGAALGSSAINAFSTDSANDATMEWQEKMYARQRQDARHDWAVQNWYNSPESQMGRLKAAGLNPNLIYGSGGGTTQSAQIKSSSPGSYRQEPVQVDLGSVLGTFMNVMKVQAQTDNMEAMLDLIRAKSIGQGLTNQFNDETMFDRQQSIKDSNLLKEQSYWTQWYNQAKIQADTAYKVQQTHLSKRLTEENISLVKERINQAIQMMEIGEKTKLLLSEKIKQAEFETSMNDIMLRGGTVSDVLKMLVQGFMRSK